MVAVRRQARQDGHFCAVINLTRFRAADGDDVYYPQSAPQVPRLLWRLRPDVIHLHIGGDLTPRLLALCLVCAGIPHSKSVLTSHSGGYPSSPQGRSARPFSLRGVVFRRLDRIIAVNREIEAMFCRFGVAPGRVRLIPPHGAPPLSDVSCPERLARFIASHRPFLLTVGLLEPEYDLPLQIEVLGKVRERHPSAGLVIAGAGSLEPALHALISQTPWGEHVLLWGDMPHAVTLRSIADCDVLLRTTHYDGDSVAVREALALGAPVIATDTGMRPPGVYLVPPRDAGALVAAIDACVGRGRGSPPGALENDQSNIEAVVKLYEDLHRAK
jgi:glycosyltransferase involved in cell wall biosynthesis